MNLKERIKLHEEEVWKEVVGFPLYMVSNLGRILSKERCFKRGDITVTNRERILNGWIRYRDNRPVTTFVSLRRDGKTHTFRKHRIVLVAFKGVCPEGFECCHNDGNPLNNHIDNLRWDSHKMNMADQVKHNTKSNPPIHIGESHPNAKISDTDVADIRIYEYKHGLNAELGRKYGVSGATIARIRNGQQRQFT